MTAGAYKAAGLLNIAGRKGTGFRMIAEFTSSLAEIGTGRTYSGDGFLWGSVQGWFYLLRSDSLRQRRR